MARAEGISIRQYTEGWLMTMNSKQQGQDITFWLVHLVEAWVGSQILFPTPVINLLLQFYLRVGLVFSIQRKLIERRLPCWKFSLISREAHVTLKAWFIDYTIGFSAHEVIPMVSGNTADIFSLWISLVQGSSSVVDQ